MFEVGGLVEVGDLDVGGLRRVRALLLDQLAQLGPPQQLLGGGTAKEFGGLGLSPLGDSTLTQFYLNVITTLVMGQPMTNETEPSRVTSETSETHVDSQMSDRGICKER